MRFRRSLRGYDPQDVMTLIEINLQKIDEMKEANQQLREKIMEFNNLTKIAENIRLEDIRRIFGLRNANF